MLTRYNIPLLYIINLRQKIHTNFLVILNLPIKAWNNGHNRYMSNYSFQVTMSSRIFARLCILPFTFQLLTKIISDKVTCCAYITRVCLLIFELRKLRFIRYWVCKVHIFSGIKKFMEQLSSSFVLTIFYLKTRLL